MRPGFLVGILHRRGPHVRSGREPARDRDDAQGRCPLTVSARALAWSVASVGSHLVSLASAPALFVALAPVMVPVLTEAVSALLSTPEPSADAQASGPRSRGPVSGDLPEVRAQAATEFGRLGVRPRHEG